MPTYRLRLTAGLLALMGAAVLPDAQAVPVTPRYAHTATLMPNRSILVAGGMTDTAGTVTNATQLILDNGSVIAGPPMTVTRASHTATVLPSGEVLVVGGWCGSSGDSSCVGHVAASAEVYNPAMNCWHTWNGGEITANVTARYDHTATLLSDGTVLICGGNDGGTWDSCDLFTPAANSAQSCGNPPGSFSNLTLASQHLQLGRAFHTATKLPDEPTDVQGRVFFAGGYNTVDGYLTTTEIFDNGKFKYAYPLSQARAGHTATMMGDGKVFISGGFDGVDNLDNLTSLEPFNSHSEGFIRSTEIYDPVGDNMAYGQTMFVRRQKHSSTLKSDGAVTVLGGMGNITNSYPGAQNAGLNAGSVITINGANHVTGGQLNSTNGLQLKDYAGALHNVTGLLLGATMYYYAVANAPTVTFSAGKVSFNSSGLGPEPNAHGLRMNLNGSQVGCSAADTCGNINTAASIFLDNPSGTVTLNPNLSVAISDVLSITAGSVQYGAFTPASQSGAQSAITGGSITADITVKGLPSEFPAGANITNATVLLTGGATNGLPYPNNDPTVSIAIQGAVASGLSGTVSVVNGTPQVTFPGAIFGSLIGAVTLTTTTPSVPPNDPIGVANKPWVSLQGVIQSYNIDKLDLTGKNLVADGAVVIVDTMTFGDDEEYKPNAGPSNWYYPSGAHGIIDARFGHTATLTSRTGIHIVGGQSCNPPWNMGSCSLVPVPNTGPAAWNKFFWLPLNGFTASGAMGAKRTYHTATTLPNGKILVAGGSNGPNVIATTELFDPVAQAFAPTGSMSNVRDLHTATLLPNGRVLVAGGYSTNALSTGAIAGCEIYYPDTGLWLPTSPMGSARSNHTATVLPDGNVLVLGGYASGSPLNTGEIYFSTSATWASVNTMPEAHYHHTATLLPDGRVLVVGGDGTTGVLSKVSIYDYKSNSWSGAAPLPSPLRYHTATMLMDGRVLVAGGNDGNWEKANTYFYDPIADSWANGPSLNVARQNHTATLLPNGTVLVAGGARAVANGGQPNQSVEAFDPGANGWGSWAGGKALASARTYHTMTMAQDGTLYAIGGFDGSNYLNSTESHGHYSSELDEYTMGSPPSTRRSHINGTDEPVLSRSDFFTTTGSRFHGLTEASGGGSDSANSDHRHPRLILQAVDGSGGGASQSNSGFIVDLTTRITANSSNNIWSKTDSSITVQVPTGLNDPNGGLLMPYGWYNLRAGANDQLSASFMVRAGPHLPSNPASLPAYPLAANIGTSSMTFTWGAPGGSWDGYDIYSATTGIFIATVGVNSFSLPGPLVASSTQSIWVKPYTLSGDWDSTNQSPLLYSATAWTLPLLPLNVFIATAPNNTFFVQWDTNTNAAGTLYEVTENVNGFISTFPLTTGNFAPATPLSLTPNTLYTFQVRACNLHGSPYGECSSYGHDRDKPGNAFVSTQTLNNISGLTGVDYATDTVVWSWNTGGSGVQYMVFNGTTTNTDPAYCLNGCQPVPTNVWKQTGLSQNTRSVIQVAMYIGGATGPLSNAATAYSLASPPFLGPTGGPGINDLSTGSVVARWNMLVSGKGSGGPGPDGNPAFYEIQAATVNWSRSTGNWPVGVAVMDIQVADSDPLGASSSTVIQGFNPSVPIYIRARALNTDLKSFDPTVNTSISYANAWVNLVSSTDASDQGFTATLATGPYNFVTGSPAGPTSVTLSWLTSPLDPTRAGIPQTSYQVLQTTCTNGGTGLPDFTHQNGPTCGVVPTGMGYANLAYPLSSVQVTGLATWNTYYFQLSAENPKHWEGTTPQVQDQPIQSVPQTVQYYAYVPGAIAGQLNIPVSAQTGGSVVNGTVGAGNSPVHNVSFSVPGAAFPSDLTLTISTIDVTDPSIGSCPGMTGPTGNLCGGDPNLAFRITASPALQPSLPLYFTVNYNVGEPNIPGVTDPKQALLLRFDPTSCQCLPVRSPGSPSASAITGELNHLSVFQVGNVQPTSTTEGMRIYPNPYYTARDSWLTIDGMPAATRVRIFTLRGELVLDQHADEHGIFTWTGTNRGGRSVASGVYLVVAEGDGIKTIRKVAVIR